MTWPDRHWQPSGSLSSSVDRHQEQSFLLIALTTIHLLFLPGLGARPGVGVREDLPQATEELRSGEGWHWSMTTGAKGQGVVCPGKSGTASRQSVRIRMGVGGVGKGVAEEGAFELALRTEEVGR